MQSPASSPPPVSYATLERCFLEIGPGTPDTIWIGPPPEAAAGAAPEARCRIVYDCVLRQLFRRGIDADESVYEVPAECAAGLLAHLYQHGMPIGGVLGPFVPKQQGPAESRNRAACTLELFGDGWKVYTNVDCLLAIAVVDYKRTLPVPVTMDVLVVIDGCHAVAALYWCDFS